jgi:hypothetical protein
MRDELAGLAALAELAELAENEELLYLAMLTAEGVKPLSRWEGPVTPRQWQALARLGLEVAAVHRPTEWGHAVTHVVFSRDRARLEAHRAAFEGVPIRFDPQRMRREGLDFGYPPCCVAAFVEHGYQDNGLPPEDQDLLFYWACPGCAETRRLLPAYRRIYRRVRALIDGRAITPRAAIRNSPAAPG